jgi:hypothetical protein
MNSKNEVIGQDEKLKQYRFPYSQRVSIYRTALGLLGSIALLLVIGLGTAWTEKIPEETNQKIKGIRVPFILNQGQMDRQVRFFAKTFSGTVYVTNQGQMVYELPMGKDRKNQGWVLVEEALDRLPVKEIKGEKESQTQVSFFTGIDPTQWKSGLSTYETVNLGEVYKGIGLKLRAYGGSVEKLYYISPGKEPKEIRIKVNGAESLKVNDQGELEARTGNGSVVFSRPKAFQQAGNHQEAVEVAYVVDKDSYGFKVGRYDNRRELIIDPLIQSTYLGGNLKDCVYSLAVIGENVYVAGLTESNNFPGTSGGAQPAFGGYFDAFVALLSSDLKELIQATYLGGGNGDIATSMAVSGGNVYVAGLTGSNNFPGTAGGAQPMNNGGSGKGFVALLSSDLKQLVQSTYVGEDSGDYFYFMNVSGENVYIAGATNSSNLPGSSGGAQITYGGNIDVCMFLLSADLKQLFQSTYLGGAGREYASSIAFSGGNVYVAGNTESTNFPGTTGGAQTGSGGSTDAFVSVLSADLKTLIQSTYLGGGAYEFSYALDFSQGGDVYVAGISASNNFPGTSGGFQPVTGGNHKGFVSLFSADLKKLIQSTGLGGSGNEEISSMVVSGGKVYVAGKTDSIDFPGTSGGAQPAYGGGGYYGADAFMSILTADLKQLVQSTYLGGTDYDEAWSMAVSEGKVYVAGKTLSTDFPNTSGGAQPVLTASHEAFVSLLSADLKAVLAIDIDIRPWSKRNPINYKGHRILPVAILSNEDFDSPSQVDQNSLTFGATGDEKSLAFCNRKPRNISRDDSKDDLVCHFYIELAGFKCGDTEGILKGKTVSGIPFKGGDLVRIINCK